MIPPSKSQTREPNLLIIGVSATLVALVLAFGFLQLFDKSGNDTSQNVTAAAPASATAAATASPAAATPAPVAAGSPTDPQGSAPPVVAAPPPSDALPPPDDANAPPPPDLNLANVGPGDRLSIPRFGVDAPLSFRVVGEDAQLPDPEGSDDVAYYNFSAWPGYGGAPGVGGNAVFAGHVDSGFKPCHNGTVQPPCEAVLWDLNKLANGDEIDVTISGVTYQYSVASNQPIADDGGDWASILASTPQEQITIITCGGDFNPETHNYDKRQVVTAVRLPS